MRWMRADLLFATGLAALMLASSACSSRGDAPALLAKARTLLAEARAAEESEKAAKLDKVEGLLQEAVAADPGMVEAHLALTRVLWEKGDQLGAVRYSQGLNKQFPENGEVWILKGDIHFQLSQWDLAREAFEKAKTLDGGNPLSTELKLGEVFGRLKDFSSAFAAFERAAELGAPEAQIHFNYALCYEGTENMDLALEELDQALTADGEYQPALLKLADLYMGNTIPGSPDLAKALEYALRAAESAPEDLKVLAILADIYIQQKDWKKVKEILDRALEIAPDAPEFLKFKSLLEKLLEEEETGKKKSRINSLDH